MNAEAMFDASVRVENIIYIPGAISDPDSPPEVFVEEFCENLPSKPTMALYSQLPALAKYSDGDEWPEPEDVAEALSGTTGFLVRAATPFFGYDASGTSADFSWGHYYTEWLYAPTEAAIIPVCVEWAKSRHDTDKLAAIAKAGGQP